MNRNELQIQMFAHIYAFCFKHYFQSIYELRDNKTNQIGDGCPNMSLNNQIIMTVPALEIQLSSMSKQLQIWTLPHMFFLDKYSYKFWEDAIDFREQYVGL